MPRDSEASLEFVDFARLVLEALEAAHVKYLIGGAVAVSAWGQARTTQDLDLVVELPIESIADLSRELTQRDMLAPVDVVLDVLIRSSGDLPINAIHMYSGYRAELFLLRPGDRLRALAFERHVLVDWAV